MAKVEVGVGVGPGAGAAIITAESSGQGGSKRATLPS